jgi:hypothetical protein
MMTARNARFNVVGSATMIVVVGQSASAAFR